ncbi:class I SAM-dependent methyltransferase [Paenibacillus kribbensis]|uniref:class I SAM-dependent methyltransferase n=1 Tax=Paenibacillus kribbensis TaxID=172713 RepID=UPI0021179E3F|nr:class I SAM-dependent methyltransferase [Paenibacillus kribbensis]
MFEKDEQEILAYYDGGAEIDLFDLSPQAIEFARQQQQNKPVISKLETADARNVGREDESADIVLLMGPLYHLTEQHERIKALQEAARVLKKGGTLITSAISRFGSLFWGLSVYGDHNTIVEEDVFMDMVRQELTNGQHVLPSNVSLFYRSLLLSYTCCLASRLASGWIAGASYFRSRGACLDCSRF